SPRRTPSGFMMKQATLEAPRSTAAITGWRASAAFRPSRCLRSSARVAVITMGLSGSLHGGFDGLGGRQARAHRDHLGIAQVDAFEAERQQAAGAVELVEADQGGVLVDGRQLDQRAVLQTHVPAAIV